MSVPGEQQQGELMDTRQIMAEKGLSRAVVDKMVRDWCAKRLGVVRPPNVRKKYVYREDVDAYIAESTRRAA